MRMRTRLSIVTLVGGGCVAADVPWPSSSRPATQTVYASESWTVAVEIDLNSYNVEVSLLDTTVVSPWRNTPSIWRSLQRYYPASM